MRKITKILTTFALCGLFTFTNTSGIEENTPVPKSVVSSDTLSPGQWYKLKEEYYDNVIAEMPITDNIIFTGSIGISIYHISNTPQDFNIEVNSLSFGRYEIRYANDTLSDYISYQELILGDNTFCVCFADEQYSTRSISSYFEKVDNSLFYRVYINKNINLISSKFQPLIYLNRLITDNIYVAFPFDDQGFSITIFTGSFYSNNRKYDKIVLDFIIFEGRKYSLDNGLTLKTFPSNSYICNGIHYQLGNSPFYTISQQKYTNVDNVNVFLGLSYRYAGDELISIESYINGFPNELMPNLNSLELINLRPNDGSGIITDGGDVLTSAFNLLALVFASLGPFLGYSIFPGITIGLLLIIPIIITLIIVIFKVVN